CAQKLLHASSFLLLTVSSLLAIATHATPPSPVRIAVYWGRNGADSTLEETCRTGLYAYVNLAYLAEFGGGMTPSKGVKVLLSIGGTFSGNYKLSSASDAQDVAAYLWNNFLGGTSAVPRPLGNASLDGIDFEVENGLGIEYYDDLAKNPVTLFDGATAGRKYMLTAAPTYCPYSGQTLDRVLRTGLFDHVWVKFYDSFVCESAVGNYRPDASIATDGFIGLQTLASRVLPVLKRSANYGGIMLWDRNSDAGIGYSAKLRSMVANNDIDFFKRFLIINTFIFVQI
ncbi:hypothetical protein BRADI_2g47196v3, partial [Brachypodium distachyon]